MKTSWIIRLFQFLFGTGNQENTRTAGPAYINYGGNIVLPAPDSLAQSLMYCFFYTSNGGNKSKLQQLLDQRLNFPANSNYRYEAFAADVILTFASTKADRSLPDRNLGHVSEKEVLFWVPALEKVKKGGAWVSNRLVWFVPYIVVDNVWALAAGREIFGLPKSLGKFEIPEDPENATTFSSTTYGFKTFSPGSALEEYPFLSVFRDDQSAGGQAGAFTAFRDGKHGFSVLKDTFMAAEGFLRDTSFRFCIHEIEDLAQMRLFWVMLKQFREITDSTSACYQAIVEGPLNIKTFHGGGLLHHSYRLQINDLASMPVAADLGLQNGQPSRAGVWLSYDFVAGLGNVLWKA